MSGHCKICGNQQCICDEILLTDTQQKIDKLFFNFSEFLKEKNKRYGDAAMNHLKIFSKHDSSEALYTRIDEKLQRIMNAEELKKNDCSDVMGYISLIMIKNNWLNFEEMID